MRVNELIPIRISESPNILALVIASPCRDQHRSYKIVAEVNEIGDDSPPNSTGTTAHETLHEMLIITNTYSYMSLSIRSNT
jgi:hypothetical protein